MKQKISFIALLLLFLLSCNENRNNKQNNVYSDGKYLAEIKYHNPKTGTKSTYTLKVKIEDDKLIKIFWSNGGWLDDSHFTPPDISSGKASFKSDKGYRYNVRIIDDDDDLSSYSDNEEDESEDNRCPECGGYKYYYDEYCDDCQEEKDEDYE